MLAIATILTILVLSLLLAMLAASLYVADVLERRAEEETDLTPEQIAMLSQLTEGQPR